MQLLEKLFGSQARVRLLKIFYQNPKKVVTQKEAVKMTKMSSRAVSKELKLLLFLSFLKKDVRTDEIKQKNKKSKLRKIKGFSLLETFPLFSALRGLLITASPVSRENLLNFFRKYRKIKLVCISGIFLDSVVSELSTDLLIVGNGAKKGVLEKFIKKLEPDLGSEINWTYFSLSEFNDRIAMHDKFLRDFFDSPNECLINKIEQGT